jgi:hypothetical protein
MIPATASTTAATSMLRHEHCLRNIERRRIERGCVYARRDRAPVREYRNSFGSNHVVARSKAGDSKRARLVR